MTCAEAQEHLHDFTRGRLDARTAAAVQAHLEGCPACAALLRTDQAIRAQVRAAVPRYTAPPALRARLEASLAEPHSAATTGTQLRPRWTSWIKGHRWAAVGAVLVVLVLAWGGWSWWRSQDAAPPLLLAAVSEHTEYREQTMHAAPAADPQAIVGKVRTEVAYPLPPTFLGDAAVQLVKGAVTDLAGRRAVTLVYRDTQHRYSTLFLLPAAGVDIPAQGHVAIDTFTPFHQVRAGRQVFLWKQAGAACVLVSDLDPADSAGMFLKIRKAV